MDLVVKCGNLMINQETDIMAKSTVKVCDSGQAGASIVHLGSLNSSQQSRRKVIILNKSPVPIAITGASVLPKSKELNEIRVDAINSKANISDILFLKFLSPSPFTTKNKNETESSRMEFGGTETEIEIFFTPRGRPIDPFSEQVLLRISAKHIPERCIWIPGFTILGNCLAANVIPETLSINFGTIVIGNSLSKSIAFLNEGNKSARYVIMFRYSYGYEINRFTWNDKTIPKGILCIEPRSGYIQAHSSKNFKFTLYSTLKTREVCLKVSHLIYL